MKVKAILKKGWFKSIIQIEALEDEAYYYQYFLHGTGICNGWREYSMDKGDVFTIRVPNSWNLNVGDTVKMSRLLEAGYKESFKMAYSSRGDYKEHLAEKRKIEK